MSDIEELRQVVFSVKDPTPQKVFDAIVEKFQGSSVYFRKLKKKNIERNDQIRAEYRRGNTSQLARKFGLCKQQILNIANAGR